MSLVAEAPDKEQSLSAPVLDHLGLIVHRLEDGRGFLDRALGISRWSEPVQDPGLGVLVQFGASPASHGLVYELVAPLGDRSPIAGALRGGKHILNHLAYLTGDLAAEAVRLRAEGCYPTGPAQPAAAYDGRPIQFWITPLRFVIELIEKPGHVHRFEEADS